MEDPILAALRLFLFLVLSVGSLGCVVACLYMIAIIYGWFFGKNE